jgi:hypothetical protein
MNTSGNIQVTLRGNRARKPRRSRADRATVAAMLERLRQETDLRDRMIRRIRAAIRARRYENDLKLQVAMERALADTIE